MINIDALNDDEKLAALESIHKSIAESKEIQKKKITTNVEMILKALKKIEGDLKQRYDETGNLIANLKNGTDGRDGKEGRDGKDGRAGKDGAMGPRGYDGLPGRNGLDGEDGVSITDAHIDFDGSLIISLSTGRVINVGEVVTADIAERIKVITNGGGTSQYVLDTLASLQSQISSITSGLDYQGTWNASTNVPTLTSSVGTAGYYYIVATAGSTNLNGITDWQVGDWAVFNGTVWQKLDQTNLVTSVAGRTGAIVLTTADIGGLGTIATQASSNVSITGGSITGITDLAIADGGTGQSTAAAAITALTGTQTSGRYLRSDGTNAALAVIVAADVPTLNQNTTGNAATVTTNANLTGDVTSVGNATTLTNAPVIAKVLTGYVSGAGTVAATDSILQAIQKLNGNDATNANLTGAVTSVGNATSLGSFTSAQLSGALTDETGSGSAVFATSPTLVTPALGTPSSGVVTNLTGTASININGTVGATTASTGAFTTLAASSTVTLSGGTANGVAYLNGSKVVTSGSSFTFNGTTFEAPQIQSSDANASVKANGNGVGGIRMYANSSGTTLLETTTDSDLIFRRNSTEGMRLTSTGLGIGTSAPAYNLEVSKSQDALTNIAVTNASAGTAAQTRLRLNNGGSNFGTITHTGASFTTSGVFRADGTYVYGNGIGGLTLTTGAAQPIYFAINNTYAASIDTSGNLLVGVTSASYSSANRGVINVGGSSGGLLALSSSTNKSYLFQSGADLLIENDTASGNLIFGTNSSTERARIDSSGNLLVGGTSADPIASAVAGISLGSDKIIRAQVVSNPSGIFGRLTTTGDLVRFYYSTSITLVGSISTNGTTTTYNVTSDQRLKENIQDSESASTLIDALQVRQFDWKSNNSHQRYGFIAQELVTVAPEAVTQPEDADEMMSVDYSKLVPMLVKEIQSLRKRLADAGI